MTNPLVINDPVYGFTVVPRGLLCDIIRHPYFQRLHRIRQLGLSGLVYPGAQHTRFQHSLGAYHLMCRAIDSLTGKGHFIFDSEIEGAEAAILMHDLGHGPFSHVLEHALTEGVSHEQISLMMMERINAALHGELGLAIKIFRDDYGKHFLHELICSQLDMDRLDYLCRDSFFTGVREGNIGADRIIKMLNVRDDRLVVESKGLYSVENYLMSRRLMYTSNCSPRPPCITSCTTGPTAAASRAMNNASTALPNSTTATFSAPSRSGATTTTVCSPCWPTLSSTAAFSRSKYYRNRPQRSASTSSARR